MSLVERRSVPRFEVDLTAVAKTEAGHQCPVRITNISSSGLQLITSLSQVPFLFPKIEFDNPLDPEHLELVIELDVLKEQVKVNVGIVYLTRCSANHCKVGCRFEAFAESDLTTFEAYIRRISNRES